MGGAVTLPPLLPAAGAFLRDGNIEMSSIMIAPASPSPQDRENLLTKLSSWVGQGRRPAGQEPKDAALSQETLDQIGAENEEIKNRCVDFVRKIDELAALRENFIEISGWIGQILAVREQTNAALVERAMMLALSEGALADLKAESRALHDSREEVLAENSLLRAENDRLKASTRSREARIEAVEADLREAIDDAAQLRQTLEAERGQSFHLKNALEAAQATNERNDAQVSQLQGDLAALRDQLVFARQHVETLQANLNESQQNHAKLQNAYSESELQAKGLADKVRELEIALESDGRQLTRLDELFTANQAEHQKAHAAWREEKEADSRHIAELEAKIDMLSAHAQARDKLLSEVRAELQAKIAESRATERRAQELEKKISGLSEYAGKVAHEAAQLKQRLTDQEGANARLSQRAKSLIRAMRDLSTEVEQSKRKAELAGERLAAETKRFDERRAQLEKTVHDLTEQLEKERLSKRVTAGALEAARQQRFQPPRDEEVKLADILARAEEAHNAAEAEAVFANGLRRITPP